MNDQVEFLKSMVAVAGNDPDAVSERNLEGNCFGLLDDKLVTKISDLLEKVENDNGSTVRTAIRRTFEEETDLELEDYFSSIGVDENGMDFDSIKHELAETAYEVCSGKVVTDEDEVCAAGDLKLNLLAGLFCASVSQKTV